MSDHRDFIINGLKLWAVFTIGVAAGAAVALIYAPQAGEKTRRRLRRGFEDAGEYIRDAADSISESAEKYVKRGKEIADNVVDTATSAYTAARKVVPI